MLIERYARSLGRGGGGPTAHSLVLFIMSIASFHSRGQHLCKFIGTKENVCIRKELNSHRTGLGDTNIFSRNELSPIRSEIIRVITRSSDLFLNHEYDYRPNLRTRSSVAS